MKTRTLVLCDDQWHPAETVRRGLGALNDSPMDFEFLEDGSKWSPELMQSFSLVIVAKANHISGTNQDPWLVTATQGTFRHYVRAGGGLMLLHAGTCCQDLPEMRGVTGGAFLSHPEQCLVNFDPKPGHPLTRGVNSFAGKDEHYVMALDAADANVFLHSRSRHGVQPAGWTRTEGSGRVCVLTPGHNLDVWLHSEYQKMLANTLCWTAKLIS